MTTSATPHVRARHFAAIGTAVTVSLLAYAAYAALRADELPSRIAFHFGSSGPDNFAPATLGLLIAGGVIVAVPALTAAAFAVTRWWESANSRWASGLCIGLAVFLAVAGMSIVATSAGLDDPTKASLNPLWLVGGLLAGAVAGFLAAFWLPVAAQSDSPEAVAALPLADSQRAAWFGDAEMHPALKYGAFAVIIGSGAMALLLRGDTGTIIAMVALVVAALAVLDLSAFRVQVDSTGLRWRSTLGFPRGAVPIADIQSVELLNVRPADFCGMGLRRTPSAIGLITRSGQALRLRRSGADFVATVDDAETAARLLETFRLAAAGR